MVSLILSIIKLFSFGTKTMRLFKSLFEIKFSLIIPPKHSSMNADENIDKPLTSMVKTSLDEFNFSKIISLNLSAE